MLTRLKIIGFQCVEEFDEDLDPGINVFMGPSGCGKSARAIRAPLLVAFNKPSSTGYLYDPRITGVKGWKFPPTTVTLWTGEGDEITRLRSPKENLYILNGNEINGFGQGVPEEVLKALNLGYANWAVQHQRRLEDERWSQMNPLYLLSMSPSEIAKSLNELAGLDDIDEAQTRMSKRLSAERSEKDRHEKTKKEKESELGQFEGIDDLNEYVARLERQELEINELADDQGRLKDAASRLRKAQQAHKKYVLFPLLKEKQRALTTVADTISVQEKHLVSMWGAADALRKAEANAEQYKQFQACKKSVAKLQEQLEVIQTAETYLQGLQRAKATLMRATARNAKFKGISALKQTVVKLQAHANAIAENEKYLDQFEDAITNLEAAETEQTKNKDLLTKANAELKAKMPDKCPLCGCTCKCDKKGAKE